MPPVAFAINSAPSRSLGTSPFEVLHGFRPRLPVQAALGVNHSILSDADDPLGFSQTLISTLSAIQAKVVLLQEKLYQEQLSAIRKKAHGQTDFEIGSYVLVRYPRQNKLEPEWRGPFIVLRRDEIGPFIYIISNLNNDTTQRIHANRLHVFWPGSLTEAELKAEAAGIDEFLIEKVFEHKTLKKVLLFRVKWLGFDYDESDAWVSFSNCRFAPEIKKYMHEHHLRIPH